MKKTAEKTTSKELHTNVDEKPDNGNSGNEELFKVEEVKGTPFQIIKMEDKYFLAMGKYRLSEPMPTYKEALENAQDSSWHRIMQIINIMINEDKNEQKYKEELQKNGIQVATTKN